MLLSIVVYTSLALILFALGRHVAQREARLKAASGQTLPFWSWEILLSIVIFAAVAGARYHTGYDHAMYLHQYVFYQKYGFFTRDFEPLFMWVTQLMAGAHIHFFFYFALWAAIEISILYYVLNRYKQLIPWVALFLVLGPVFIHLMNTVRQGLVECSVPLLLTLVQHKRNMLFVLLVLTLSMIHYTAIILLALYLFRPNQDIRLSTRAMLLLIIISCGIGCLPQWINLIKEISREILAFFGNYVDLLDTQSGRFQLSFGPMKIIALMSQLFLFGLVAKTLKNEKSAIWVLGVVCALIYAIGVNLFANTSNYYQRPFELFTICLVVMAAFVTLYFYRNKMKLLTSLSILINCSYIYLAVLKAWLNPTPNSIPFHYHFFF